MAVDRCICHDVGFDELLRFARRHGADLDTLQRRFGCGTGCGLCIPYIRVMLRTGRTSFEPTLAPEEEDGGPGPGGRP